MGFAHLGLFAVGFLRYAHLTPSLFGLDPPLTIPRQCRINLIEKKEKWVRFSAVSVFEVVFEVCLDDVPGEFGEGESLFPCCDVGHVGPLS